MALLPVKKFCHVLYRIFFCLRVCLFKAGGIAPGSAAQVNFKLLFECAETSAYFDLVRLKPPYI